MEITRSFFALLLVLSCVIAIPNAIAQTESDKKTYTIGTYLLNVGKIDLQNGAYDLDFYIWIKSDDANFIETKPKIEFMNGKATTEPITVEKNYYEARVKGIFQKNMDFRNYPFEKILLTIEIEGTEDMKSFEFVPDLEESGVDDLVNIPGWNLQSTNSDVTIHKYSDDSEYSRYVFSLEMERFPLSSFLKTMLPVIIITTIAMLAFWMSPTNFTARIGLGASTLLAAVAAHLNAANQLPPIGYLTLFDKIMIIAYALFLNNLLSMVIQMRLIDHKREEEAVKVNAKMRKAIPVICVLIFLALFLV
ncbi:hypothetical protein Nlim_0991 [Candidatus Nitrosarchaeum limnium SFB1]|jgi:hypothetical protein|uniref:Neurotransmitter-gated ion-channel ligand-binding domain-containing protein n=1 Tax=Candidatus Nitrosarchaeum limnium SFB1 TaxID=886738 RepID=F3KKH4_9ARCH|nr:hypothetical protein Nlim_0991 [Candidatus Nitrosarchaeum limnium SFB1]